MKRAAIIGSGIGGLGAAISLAAKGYEVHVSLRHGTVIIHVAPIGDRTF